MLKTRVGSDFWLVHQPDHARVSGYLAAHWGGAGDFAKPGFYPGSSAPELWRQEVVHAVAEHDNGWWEWEAAPKIDAGDGLPLDLADVAADDPAAGLVRWRLGVPRLAEEHPYAALLISLHSYWLYAFAYDDLVSQADDALRHPLLLDRFSSLKLVRDRDSTREYLEQSRITQSDLKERIGKKPDWARAVEPAHLDPHLKLLQLMDALSLLLCFNDCQRRRLPDVPRRDWSDRVELNWRPSSDGRRIAIEPYPFDRDPLQVLVPARVVPAQPLESQDLPMTRLHASPIRCLGFQFASG